MNSLSKWSIFAFALSLVVLRAVADGPSISDTLWEKYSEGLALAQTVTDHSIVVRVKNTSNTLKQIANQGSNVFIKLFYIDDKDKQVSLGNHLDPAFDEDIQNNPSSIAISPGGEMKKTIALTPDELDLIKTHPVKCSMVVYEPTTNQRYTIESIPRLLTQK